MYNKIKMTQDWDIEEHRLGPKEGDVLQVVDEYWERGSFICWEALYAGETYSIYPYEAEEIQ